MSVATAWVNPPRAIMGQDHLGVRAPCEAIYKQLLPGITNVTDRARYYSFYPWLLWAFERHDGKLRRRPFFHTLRRADCLFTLIAGRHDSEGEGGNVNSVEPESEGVGDSARHGQRG